MHQCLQQSVNKSSYYKPLKDADDALLRRRCVLAAKTLTAKAHVLLQLKYINQKYRAHELG